MSFTRHSALTLGVALWLFSAILAAEQNSTATYTSNRYLLFSGAFVVEGTGKTFQGVFKLDTFTGDTWYLQLAVVNGKVMRRWVLISASREVPKDRKGLSPEDLRAEDQN